MTVSSAVAFPLLVLQGLFWTLTYILIIQRGFKDRALGMPMLALAANIAWEFIFAFVHPSEIFPQRYANIVWVLFDAAILVQVLLYGARDYHSPLIRKLFHPAFALALIGSFAVLLPVASRFHDQGAIYSGMVMNVMMSVLFVCMLVQRDSIKGQSLYIALAKLLGTLFAFLTIYGDELGRFTYSIIFVFDVGYALALYAKIRQAGLSPWKRL